MSASPLVIESVLNAPINRVWKAITDKDQIRKWSFNVSDFKPEPGFEFHFEGGADGVQYVHECRITEVITGRKLVHTWSYKDYPEETMVTIELLLEGNHTRIKLTHEGLEKIPAKGNPHFDLGNFVAGWNHIIGKSLKEYVEA